MREYLHVLPDPDPDDPTEPVPAIDTIAGELSPTVRCPVCRAVLFPRQTCAGPYLACYCTDAHLRPPRQTQNGRRTH